MKLADVPVSSSRPRMIIDTKLTMQEVDWIYKGSNTSQKFTSTNIVSYYLHNFSISKNVCWRYKIAIDLQKENFGI